MTDRFAISIEDITDPRISRYVDLRHARSASKAIRGSETFIAEGRLVVERLVDSDFSVESILVQPGGDLSFLDRVTPDVSVFSMPKQVISQVVGYDFHRGVLACGRRQPMLSIADFVASIDSNPGDLSTLSLALLGITEQENMGSILRTAAAFGIHRILLGPKTIDPFSRRVIRVSMANVFKHRFYQIQDPVADLATINEAGVSIIASTLQGEVCVERVVGNETEKLLLIGNEASGLDQDVQDIATNKVTIPMRSGVDSLNASVAAAILMYELTSAQKKKS